MVTVDDKWNYIWPGSLNTVSMGPYGPTHKPSHKGEVPPTKEETFHAAHDI